MSDAPEQKKETVKKTDAPEQKKETKSVKVRVLAKSYFGGKVRFIGDECVIEVPSDYKLPAHLEEVKETKKE